MALSNDRTTPQMAGDLRSGGLAASVVVYAGALLMRNAAGHLTKGQTALGLVGVGRAEERASGSAAAGEVKARYRPGIFRFLNSSAGDLITVADIGKPAYAVDDERVAKTSATNTRSIAGFIEEVDAQGVWVRFDEALVQAYLT